MCVQGHGLIDNWNTAAVTVDYDLGVMCCTQSGPHNSNNMQFGTTEPQTTNLKKNDHRVESGKHVKLRAQKHLLQRYWCTV